MDIQDEVTIASLQRVRQGDIEAYEEVVTAFFPRVRAFLYQRCPNPDAVDEIAHETFVWAFDHLDRFTIGTQFGAWIVSVAHFKLKAYLEEHKRLRRNQINWLEEVQIHQNHFIEEDEEGKDLDRRLQILENCIEKLPTHLAEIVRLRYWAKVPFEDLAKRLNRSKVALRVALHRTRSLLRHCMEQELFISAD